MFCRSKIIMETTGNLSLIHSNFFPALHHMFSIKIFFYSVQIKSVRDNIPQNERFIKRFGTDNFQPSNECPGQISKETVTISSVL